MPDTLKTPVAFIIFNRPKCTRRVFAEIRKARPQKLYLIADGPRPDKKGEADICVETRQLVESMIDWPCELRKDYAEQNMGCRWRVASGITNVFEQEEAAIILEDDCLPSQSFFTFCAEMLARYKDEPRIMQVCGTKKYAHKPLNNESYFFSKYTFIWGWATWRRAWRLYDAMLGAWPEQKKQKLMYTLGYPDDVCRIRENQIDRIYNGELDTWDFGWAYTVMLYRGLTIVPNQNLVQNIGFGRGATHTGNPFSRNALRIKRDIKQPLISPASMMSNERHDQQCSRDVVPSMLNLLAQSILSRFGGNKLTH